MSLSLLRQFLRQSQPSLFQRAGRAAAIRLNSTSSNSDYNTWGSSIRVDDYTAKQRSTNLNEAELEKLWKSYSEKFLGQHSLATANAFTGRTVNVVGGDIATAAKRLDTVLSQNGVPREWFTNRRHKQKGEERRRLKSMRHRRRFAQEVGKMVQLVQQARRRGT